MNTRNDTAAMQRLFDDLGHDMIFRSDSLPLRERVLNRLADLMFCADDVLQMIAGDPAGRSLAGCEKPVRRAYDSINSLMKALCD